MVRWTLIERCVPSQASRWFTRLHNEFPELVAATQPDAGPFTITEIGCGTQPIFLFAYEQIFYLLPKGAGNSIFPLLAANRNPDLHLRAYDYSSHAVKLVKVCFICFKMCRGDTYLLGRVTLCTHPRRLDQSMHRYGMWLPQKVSLKISIRGQ